MCISDKRKEELYAMWGNELTEDDEEWRDDLTEEEATLVDQWDEKHEQGIHRIAEDILNLEAKLTGSLL